MTTEAATTTTDSPRTQRAEARDGDASARIAALFAEQARAVLGICRSMLRDPAEAEDAAQQTFVSAYGSLLSGTVPDDEAAWIATIARNECRGRIRARMREPLVALDPELAEAPDDAHAVAIRRSEVVALRRALVELPVQQRRAFVLREFGGLSYEELAESLSVSLASVESLLFRARRQLRTSLQPVVSGTLSVPFVLRDLLLRLVAGGGESTGAAAKIASLPIAAKLAAAGTGVVLVTGGAVGLEGERVHHLAPRAAAPPAVRRVAPARRPAPVVRQAIAVTARPPAAPPRHALRAVVPAAHETETARHGSRHGSSHTAPEVTHRSAGRQSGGGGHQSRHGTPPATPPPAVEPTEPVEPAEPEEPPVVATPPSPAPALPPTTEDREGPGAVEPDEGSGSDGESGSDGQSGSHTDASESPNDGSGSDGGGSSSDGDDGSGSHG